MKLQLEHIQGYLAHGLKVICNHGAVTKVKGAGADYITYQVYEDDPDEHTCDECSTIIFVTDLYHSFQPILRKLDLTKIITVNGVEIVPIVELAKISLPDLQWVLDDGFAEAGITEFQYQSGSFYAFGFQDLEVPNQLQLFKWLYANKFDVEGLIDSGLAIDADTLETNPYNS